MGERTKVLITGATGFTGRFVAGVLLGRQDRYEVSLFARSNQKVASVLPGCRATVHCGEFERPETLAKALAGQDILLNVASLGFGHADTIVSECRRASLKRAVFVSSTSIYTHLNPASKAVRVAAEECIRSSELAYTIVRPTMICGAPGDRNVERLIQYVRRWPVLFVPGPGTYQLQPVYVRDLADALCAIIEHSETVGREYNLSGRDALSYNALVRTVASLTGRRCSLIHLPLSLMVAAFHIYARLVPKPKITVEQLLRLNEDKAFSHSDATRDFGYSPTPFRQVLETEIGELHHGTPT